MRRRISFRPRHRCTRAPSVDGTGFGARRWKLWAAIESEGPAGTPFIFVLSIPWFVVFCFPPNQFCCSVSPSAAVSFGFHREPKWSSRESRSQRTARISLPTSRKPAPHEKKGRRRCGLEPRRRRNVDRMHCSFSVPVLRGTACRTFLFVVAPVTRATK